MSPLPAPRSLAELLDRAGVTDATLGSRDRKSLDELGYVVLRDMLTADERDALRALFEEVAEQAKEGTRHTPSLDTGHPLLEVIYAHPRFIAACAHVLGRTFELLHIGGRDPRQGFGLQGLHADWPPRTRQDPYSSVTAIWLLDDFEAETGATRVVPGSHRLLKPLPRSMQAPGARHPGEVRVLAPAGSALIFNSHLWHSGCRNDSPRCRRVLQCQYVGSEQVPPSKEPPVAAEKLSTVARWIRGG